MRENSSASGDQIGESPACATAAISIQIGSVHLGWHYAIDGYFGAVLAALCWYAGKSLAQRFP